MRRYETLWSWEFSSRPASIHDRARDIVAQDVARLKSLRLNQSFHVLRTIESGYRLLGDEAKQHAMELRIRETFPDSRALLIDTLLPQVSLPRNWLVNRESVVVYEQKGYNEQPPDQWLREQGLSLLNGVE